MRLTSHLTLATLACVLLPCCEKVGSQQIPSSDIAVLAATTMLDTTTTLGKWLKANPRDSSSSVYPLYANDPSFCRASISGASVANHHAKRVAVFSIMPPANEQLPPDTLNAESELCRLTTILVETDEMDSATAVALDDEITKAIAAN